MTGRTFEAALRLVEPKPGLTRLALVGLAAAILACGGEDVGVTVRSATREPGELALPPSANAPRVMREEQPPDTLVPDSIQEFAILGADSALPGIEASTVLDADLSIDAITTAYRGHYAAALESEGSAVAGRIDRELQHQAELRTARAQGFADWTELVGALSPEQRARLVDRLNEANVQIARELHGTPAPQEPPGTSG